MSNWDISPIRQRMIDLARSYDGASADDARYLDLIAPNETKERRRQMGLMSGCALTVMAFWRLLGLVHELLDAHYIDGQAPAWLMKIARDRHALFEGKEVLREHVVAGNVLIVDGFWPSFHTFTLVDPQPVDADRFAVLSIDGGQRIGTDRAEGIVQVKRRIEFANGMISDYREDPPPTLARRVTHAIDLDLLFAA